MRLAHFRMLRLVCRSASRYLGLLPEPDEWFRRFDDSTHRRGRMLIARNEEEVAARFGIWAETVERIVENRRSQIAPST